MLPAAFLGVCARFARADFAPLSDERRTDPSVDRGGQENALPPRPTHIRPFSLSLYGQALAGPQTHHPADDRPGRTFLPKSQETL